MVFNSIPFLIFISVVLPLYWYLKGTARQWLCLIASYFFYGWWDVRFLSIVAFTTILDFSLGILIEDTTTIRARKRMVLISVLANLSFLGFFKYFNFFADSFIKSFHAIGFKADWTTLHIILQIGISFYTFQSMSYTIDVYRNEIKAERNFWRYATFVSFFPQLVAGPIVRAKQFLPQFQNGDRPFVLNKFLDGLTQVMWGFFKKVAIADTVAPFVDQIFAFPTNFSALSCIIGIIFYSIQIYADFSGYSNIACGLAEMMGFEFPWNFRTPYFSKNFSEFWTRWHISLSSWLRDYLYISLGGSRNGKLMTYRNNMLTMLIGGLWHGANWTFVFWGFLHGTYLIGQRLLSKPFRAVYNILRVPHFLRVGIDVLIVYTLTCFAWVFFRAPNFSLAWQVIRTATSGQGMGWNTVLDKFIVIKCAILILILISAELIHNNIGDLQNLTVRSATFRVASYAILIWLISFFGTFGSGSFIYFQF